MSEYEQQASKLRARIAELEAERDRARELAGGWLECLEVMERATDGLNLPLESTGDRPAQTDDELSKWTDAITTILKNIGLAQSVVRAFLARAEGKTT